MPCCHVADYSRGFGGKYGVQKDRMDKVSASRPGLGVFCWEDRPSDALGGQMAVPWVVSGLWWVPGACLQKRERFRQACVITVAVPLADTRAGFRLLCHGCPLLDPSRPRCEAVAVPVTYWGGGRGPWPGRRRWAAVANASQTRGCDCTWQ